MFMDDPCLLFIYPSTNGTISCLFVGIFKCNMSQMLGKDARPTIEIRICRAYLRNILWLANGVQPEINRMPETRGTCRSWSASSVCELYPPLSRSLIEGFPCACRRRTYYSIVLIPLWPVVSLCLVHCCCCVCIWGDCNELACSCSNVGFGTGVGSLKESLSGVSLSSALLPFVSYLCTGAKKRKHLDKVGTYIGKVLPQFEFPQSHFFNGQIVTGIVCSNRKRNVLKQIEIWKKNVSSFFFFFFCKLSMRFHPESEMKACGIFFVQRLRTSEFHTESFWGCLLTGLQVLPALCLCPSQ